MTRKLILAAAFAALSTVAADAQSGSRIVIESPSSGARQEGFVRIQASINMFMPGPTGESEESVKLRDRGRRLVYEMAARECDLLRDVLAKDCRLESVNAGIGRQYGQQQVEGYQINGQMSLQS